MRQNLTCADNDFSFNSPCNDLFFMLTLCLGKIWSPPLVRRREVVWTASSSCAGRKLDILRYPSHRNRTGGTCGLGQYKQYLPPLDILLGTNKQNFLSAGRLSISKWCMLEVSERIFRIWPQTPLWILNFLCNLDFVSKKR